ncbi:MAG: spore coat protein YlbD [Sporolactobacillus sp.]
MVAEKTNESVRKFKVFIKTHPEIISHVRKNGLKWNDVFDDWALFGDSSELWANYGVNAEKKPSSDQTDDRQIGAQGDKKSDSAFSWTKILETLDTLDTKQWQERLDTLSSALGGLQTFIGQFKQKEESKTEGTPANTAAAHSPQSERTQPVYTPPQRIRRNGLFRKD